MSRQSLRVLANFIINKSMSQIVIEHKYEQIKKKKIATKFSLIKIIKCYAGNSSSIFGN